MLFYVIIHSFFSFSPVYMEDKCGSTVTHDIGGSIEVTVALTYGNGMDCEVTLKVSVTMTTNCTPFVNCDWSVAVCGRALMFTVSRKILSIIIVWYCLLCYSMVTLVTQP